MERTLTNGSKAPHTKYSKEKVAEHKRQIQEILGALNPRSLPLNGNLSTIEDGIPTGPAVSGGTNATSVAESGMSSSPLPPILCGMLTVPLCFPLNFNTIHKLVNA